MWEEHFDEGHINQITVKHSHFVNMTNIPIFIKITSQKFLFKVLISIHQYVPTEPHISNVSVILWKLTIWMHSERNLNLLNLSYWKICPINTQCGFHSEPHICISIEAIFWIKAYYLFLLFFTTTLTIQDSNLLSAMLDILPSACAKQ